MATWLRWAAAALLLASLAMPADAGTVDDAEITDAPDDSGGPVSEQDVVLVWIGDTPGSADGVSTLDLHLQTAGDFQHAPGFFALSIRYRVAFVHEGLGSGVENYVTIVPSVATTAGGTPGSETVGCRFGQAAPGESQPIETETVLTGAIEAGNQFLCQVPLSLLSGYSFGKTVSGFYVEQQLVRRGPTNGGDVAGVEVLEVYDRAPDADFGRLWPKPEETPPVPPAKETELPSNETVEEATNETVAPPEPEEGTEEESGDESEEDDRDRSAPEREGDVEGGAEDAKKTPGVSLAHVALGLLVAGMAFRGRRRDRT